jgi:HEAT repeat protein
MVIPFIPVPPQVSDDLASLRAALVSPSAEVRRGAYRAARQGHRTGLLREIIREADDPSPLVQWEAGVTIQSLWERALKDPSASQPGVTKESDLAIREQLRLLQGIVSDPETRAALHGGVIFPTWLHALRHRDDGAVRGLVTREWRRASGHSADPEEIPTVGFCGTSWVAEENPLLTLASRQRPRVLVELVRIAMTEDPERAYLVPHLDEACRTQVPMDEWRRWLDSPSSQVREVAALEVSERKDRAAWNTLVARLDDPAASVRIRAAQALLAIDAGRAHAPIWRRLERTRGDEFSALAWVAQADLVGIDRALKRLADRSSSERRQEILSVVE